MILEVKLRCGASTIHRYDDARCAEVDRRYGGTARCVDYVVLWRCVAEVDRRYGGAVAMEQISFVPTVGMVVLCGGAQ